MCIQINTYQYRAIHTCSCTSKKRLPQNALSSRWYPPRILRVFSYADLLQMRVAFQATSWSLLRSNSALPSALSLPSAARCTALRTWDAFRRGNVSASHRRVLGHVHTLHVCGPEPQKASASGWSPRSAPISIKLFRQTPPTLWSILTFAVMVFHAARSVPFH